MTTTRPHGPGGDGSAPDQAPHRVPLAPPPGIRSSGARLVLRRAMARLPLRVYLPDGSFFGGGGPDDPAMALRRPDDFFARIGADAKIGFGEAYMAEDWDPADGTDLADLLTPLAVHVDTLLPSFLQRFRRVAEARRPIAEESSPHQAGDNIRRHYDLSNDLFAAFLDETMSYSSALFAPGDDLAAGQRRKIAANLDAAAVTSGSRLLEIGSGWGELAIEAARRGARVTSVTLSEAQLDLARRRVAAAGVGDRVEVVLADYRSVTGSYDAVVSVEMIEAVGMPYWDEFFATLDRLLLPGGRVALQSITMPHHRMWAARRSYTWVHKYIFPGGMVPSVEAVEDCVSRTSLSVETRHDFGPDYATTLRQWRERFLANWPHIEGGRFDREFRRMWEFYLAYAEAGFAGGFLGVSIFGLSKT